MQQKYLILALLFSMVGAGCSNLERSRDLSNPAVSGRVLAEQVCSNCHGLDGNSISPLYPRLAGQQADYLKSQLNGFRAKQRSDPAGSEYMWGISRHLTDEQIASIAEYYSAQKMKPNKAGDPSAWAKGKEIFESGVPDQAVIPCSACHGPNGQGLGAFPRLANQHADYLVKQLNVFQNTQQRPGTPMEAISHPLTGENKDAVATFLQAFPE